MPGPLPIGQVRMKKYFLRKNTTSLRGPDGPFFETFPPEILFKLCTFHSNWQGSWKPKMFCPWRPHPCDISNDLKWGEKDIFWYLTV